MTTTRPTRCYPKERWAASSRAEHRRRIVGRLIASIVITAGMTACDGLHGMSLFTDPGCDPSTAGRSSLPSDPHYLKWYDEITAFGRRQDMTLDQYLEDSGIVLSRSRPGSQFDPVIKVRPAGGVCALLEISQFGPYWKTQELRALEDSLVTITQRYFPDAVVTHDY